MNLILLTIITICLIILSIGLLIWFQLKSQQQSINREYLQNLIDNLNARIEDRARFSDDLIRKINQESHEKLLDRLGNSNLHQQRTLSEFKETIQQALNQHRAQFDERQISTQKLLQDSLQSGLLQHAESLSKRVEKLTNNTDERLKEISGQVEKRLSEGFEKTTATFTDVIKRLALIDEAQKKITDLSTNVVSLQEILSDKKSRGAFGEVQLSGLIRNLLPEKNISFQHSLSNGKRADCMIFLPQPTGNVAIDAKFPLETYRRMTDANTSRMEKTTAERQFRVEIQKHITDISSKYIIPGETSDGAVMFIPAEAVFAEIHANFPDLVDKAQQNRVWMVSPTTMMAILTTARAVLKDEATRKQVHIIQEHLNMLAKDFDRFQIRMNNLAKHVNQAHKDVEDVHKTASKISSRFSKIEKAELTTIDQDLPPLKKGD